ncbi:glycine/betaine ABC transporter ATP-binding protein [Sphingobacteriaceae bacterium]|nr:glycine/betaine ABC transporter ATP-binding protein [Sphingobacteriaceae bacterium]
MIEVKEISKKFGTALAADNISFRAASSQTLVLLGTSGCGKTTTLKMLNRLIEPDTGTILMNGNDIRNQKPEELRRGIGYVMQHGGLFPHYSIRDNIAIVPRLLRWDEKRISKRTYELLQMLNLATEILDMYPRELSGGQQQRIGIARALISNSPVLLMDEPFSALDNVTRAAIQSEFKALEELKNKTIVMVTHDVQEAFKLGDKICLMDKGAIVQTGSPAELLFNPVNDFAKTFLNSHRLLLEYQVVKLQDLGHLHANPQQLYIDTALPLNASVWAAMEKLSSDKKYSDSYDELIKAFHDYRKKVIH